VIHFQSKDFVKNTLDRCRTNPKKFLKRQYTFIKKAEQLPGNLLSRSNWQDFLGKLIEDVWDVRCQVAHFEPGPLLGKLGLETNLTYFEIMQTMIKVVQFGLRLTG